MTDAGYLDEPTVVWERLNEIDGDTEYFNANFRPLNVSETNQQSILTRQEQEKQQRALDEAKRLQETAAEDAKAESTADGDGVHELTEDPDYLLALKLQEEEEALVNGSRSKQLVSPAMSPRRNPSPVSQAPQQAFSPVNFADVSDDDDSGNDRGGSSHEASQFEETSDSRVQTGSPGGGARSSSAGANLADQNDDVLPFTEDGQLILSEEELEAQRQAERFYQERKRQFEHQAYQMPPPPQQQPRGSTANRSNAARQTKEDKGECSVM